MRNENYAGGGCVRKGATIVIDGAIDYTYVINSEDGIITLLRYTGSATEVVVPSTITLDGETYSVQVGDNRDAGTNPNVDHGLFSGNANLTSVKFEDGVELISGYAMFMNCSALKSVDFGEIDTSACTTLQSMFFGCRVVDGLDFSEFDTSGVTNMNFMFVDCTGMKTVDVSSFDTSACESMSSLFSGCESLTAVDVTNFDTALVDNFGAMFAYCMTLTELDLRSFDTHNAFSMAYMFEGCTKLTKILVTKGKWTTEDALDAGMFRDCGCSGVTYA